MRSSAESFTSDEDGGATYFLDGGLNGPPGIALPFSLAGGGFNILRHTANAYEPAVDFTETRWRQYSLNLSLGTGSYPFPWDNLLIVSWDRIGSFVDFT